MILEEGLIKATLPAKVLLQVQSIDFGHIAVHIEENRALGGVELKSEVSKTGI